MYETQTERGFSCISPIDLCMCYVTLYVLLMHINAVCECMSLCLPMHIYVCVCECAYLIFLSCFCIIGV